MIELDTGVSMAEIPWKKTLESWPYTQVENLHCGEGIQVLGQRVVRVEYSGLQHSLPLVVVGGDGPTLLGRNWLEFHHTGLGMYPWMHSYENTRRCSKRGWDRTLKGIITLNPGLQVERSSGVGI